MDPATKVAVAGIALAFITSLTVPMLAFRLTMRQDRVRWLREQRAQLYVDLLAEAYAEQQYSEFDMADDDTRQRAAAWFQDLRLPPLERAQLGARGTIFGSREVNALFNEMQRQAIWHSMSPHRDEGTQITARIGVGEYYDKLQAAVQRELGADRLLREGRTAPPKASLPRWSRIPVQPDEDDL